MKKQKLILILLILLLFIINYSFLDKTLENFLSNSEFVVVQRVIDGDTIVAGNNSIRLLGINSPEKGEKYYNESKEFLEKLILDKEVRFEFGKEKYDQYKRILAYVYINNMNINIELVKNGFANFYFPSGKDMHYKEFVQAWKSCIESNKNLCQKSNKKCSECIELNEFDSEKERITIDNQCGFSCDLTNWEIKDEGRKNFVFPKTNLNSNEKITIQVGEGNNNNTNLFWKGEKYVWTETGDTLFLRDENAGLILYKSY
ncbi:MAG: thermonuclease family protein [archaeon]